MFQQMGNFSQKTGQKYTSGNRGLHIIEVPCSVEVENAPPELWPLSGRVLTCPPLSIPHKKRVNPEGVGVKGKVGVAVRNVWVFIMVLG